MQSKLSLRYEGAAVDAGEMDVYEVASNLVAFSDFVVAAAKATYGDSADVRADVVGLRSKKPTVCWILFRPC